MGKSKIHEFYSEIYPRKLWVVKGLNKKDLNNTFAYRNGSEIEFEYENGNESLATVFPNVILKDNGKYGYLVFIHSSNISVGAIAHEAVHVATELFSEIGAIHTKDNQEPFAYLVGWIADCIYQVKTGRFRC